MMAASVLALIPAVLFFVFIQRYLVQGLTAGGGEGVTRSAGRSYRSSSRWSPKCQPRQTAAVSRFHL